jgi:hypothetical protein
MEAIPQLKASEIKPYLQILESIQDNHLLQRFEVDIQARIEDVKEQVKISADAGTTGSSRSWRVGQESTGLYLCS